MKLGRNEPCVCGSGRKFKHCCQGNPRGGDRVSAQLGGGRNVSSELLPSEQNQLIALYQAGRHAELESQAANFLKRYPDSGLGWKLLSLSLLFQGKEASGGLEKASKLLPLDTDVLSLLGNTLAERGKLEEATACFQRVLSISPGNADAYYNLGQMLAKLSRDADAERCFRKVVEFRSDDADAHNNLGVVLRNQRKHAEAEASFRRAIALKPDLAEAVCCLGSELVAQGNFAEAEGLFRRALELKPGLAEANSCLGNELVAQGRFAEAEACFRRALDSRPDYVLPRFSLVESRKVQVGDEDFGALVSIGEKFRAGKIHLTADEVVSLHYGLGKCYDDVGDYDKAFEHYLEGARLKRATYCYDANRDTSAFDEIRRIFDARKIESLRGSGDSTRVPIFVLGMPRSGTTLTEQIIASHPDVYGAGELRDLMQIVQRNIAGTSFPESLRLLDQAQVAAWGAEYLAALRRHAPDARHITDKTPANFLAIGLIHLMMPNAKIIHVRRNPVDSCLSCFTRLFADGNVQYSYDLAELGRFYVNYARLMEHWHSVLPAGTFLDVQYEDIVQDPERQARRLIEYCGLEWDPGCLSFYENKRSVRTASVTQVRQSIYKSSMERWRRYESHLAPLLGVLEELPSAF